MKWLVGEHSRNLDIGRADYLRCPSRKHRNPEAVLAYVQSLPTLVSRAPPPVLA
jgi:hypothetical protein